MHPLAGYDVVEVLRDFLLVVVGVTVAALFARSGARAWTKDRAVTQQTLAAFRWWMPLGSVVTTAVVFGVVAVVERVPGLSWGWYRLIAGIDGNVLVGQSDGHLGASRVLAVLIPVLLLLAVPREARIEEEFFRGGNHERSRRDRMTRAAGFGFIHCLVGVPLSVGVALIFAGLYYDLVYEATVRRQHRRARQSVQMSSTADEPGPSTGLDDAETRGVDAATAAHSVSNALLLTALIVSWSW